jgi:hypothetical protein
VLERPNRASQVALQVDELIDAAATEDLRRRCRQCRAKLATPVSNARKAFCCSGCQASFFRARCEVCEEPIEQPIGGGARFTCDRAKCKRARRSRLHGRYPNPNAANAIQERPVNTRPKVAINDDLASPWVVVAAGAPISANQYHCATVGAAEAIAGVARTNAAHWSRGRRL